jgi:hypothetical protein
MGDRMPQNRMVAVVLATGIWVIFGMAITLEFSGSSQTNAWSIASSERMASRPVLVRGDRASLR